MSGQNLMAKLTTQRDMSTLLKKKRFGKNCYLSLGVFLATSGSEMHNVCHVSNNADKVHCVFILATVVDVIHSLEVVLEPGHVLTGGFLTVSNCSSLVERQLIVMVCGVEVLVGWLDGGSGHHVDFALFEEGVEVDGFIVKTCGFNLSRGILESDIKHLTCKREAVLKLNAFLNENNKNNLISYPDP